MKSSLLLLIGVFLVAPALAQNKAAPAGDVDAAESQAMQANIDNAIKTIGNVARTIQSQPSNVDINALAGQLGQAAKGIINYANPTGNTDASPTAPNVGNATEQALPASDGKSAGAVADVLDKVNTKNPSALWQSIDSLVNLLPNDSTIKPMILEFINLIKSYSGDLEKSSHAE